MILSNKPITKGLIRLCRLVCVCVDHKLPKTGFLTLRSIKNNNVRWKKGHVHVLVVIKCNQTYKSFQIFGILRNCASHRVGATFIKPVYHTASLNPNSLNIFIHTCSYSFCHFIFKVSLHNIA